MKLSMFVLKENKIKKKILFLDHTPFIGGAQLCLINHLKTINKDVFNVFACCSENAGEIGLVGYFNKLKIKYYFVRFEHLKSYNPAVLLRLIKTVCGIIKIINKEKIDLIFANTVRAIAAGSTASLITNSKIVWFIHDYTFPRNLFRILKFIPKKIFYNSKSTANYYSSVIDEKNKVIYIGNDFYKNKITEKQIKQKREGWKVDNNTIVIGYVGRLVEDKGAHILINAVNFLIKKGIKNIKCIIVGTGKGQKENNEQKLTKLAKELNLLNYVVFAGYQKNIQLYISSFDVLCFTSIKKEAFGIVIIESMMCGIPVISTDIAGPNEIIKNEATGLLVEPNNAKALSDAVERLIFNKRLKERMANNAYKYVMEHHTSEKFTKDLEAEYLDVLKT